jgi:glycine cleavage system regulatory protein
MYVNAVGADRTGIVSDMTKFVTDAGGNVGRSQAARLGDQFSLMMQIEVPTDKVQTLREQLQGMPGMNATIFEAKKAETNLTPHIACKKKNSIGVYFIYCQ